MQSDYNGEDFVVMPITGELDLHTFRPSEIKDLLPSYFEECIKVGILEVRVIHGKGTGALRTTVHALLRKMTLVHSFRMGLGGEGSWGATLVYLIKQEETV